jgi:Cu(I)/Ag(I) efflux system membrane protein CusA/SilA
MLCARTLERAKAKLKIVVPITLMIVFFLIFLNTRSLIETGIVLLAVPFSLVGAIWLVYLLHYNISVAVWIGMIALAGGCPQAEGAAISVFIASVRGRPN